MKAMHLYRNLGMVVVGMMSMLAISYKKEIDNAVSRNQSEIELIPSGEYIKLNGSRPSEAVFTLKWSTAHSFGEDYIIVYKYEMQLIGSDVANIKEFGDDGEFSRLYTNREMQDILIDYFSLTTSTIGEVLLTAIASSEGFHLMVSDIVTATVKFRTYGPRQYKTDNLCVGGIAVGDDNIKMTLKDGTSRIYSYEGVLVAGKINFSVDYTDELSVVGLETADAPITTGEMADVIPDRAEVNPWLISSAATYCTTTSMSKQTVKIIETGTMAEADQVFLAGGVVGGEQTEVAQALGNDQVYIWRGTPKADDLCIPFIFEGEQAMAVVPEVAGSRDTKNDQLSTLRQVLISKMGKQYWTIPADGTYRIVLNKERKSTTTYSTATGPKLLTVSFNNAELGKNPWSQKANVLCMYDGPDSSAYDSDIDEGAGKSFRHCQVKCSLIQGVINPKAFIYKGNVLPRNEYKDNYGKINTDWMNLNMLRCVNNEWFASSTVDVVHNSRSGCTTVTADKIEGVVTGQSNNRYTYFLIPEGCNYVIVSLENNIAFFGIK